MLAAREIQFSFKAIVYPPDLPLAKIARTQTSFYSEDLKMIKDWMAETGSATYHDVLVKVDVIAFGGVHIRKEFERKLAEPAEETKLVVPFQ